jgi:hypothetical protein
MSDDDWRNKMDGDHKMYLGVTVAIVAGILGAIGTGAGLATHAAEQGNAVKIACVKSGKALVYDQCVPPDKIALVTAATK